MGYCTLADVKSLLKGFSITDDTKITETEVETYIEDFTQLIDSKVVRKYTVPVTDTEALVIVKIICKKLTASHVLQITYLGSNKNLPDGAKNWRKDALDMLKAISENDINLTVEDSTDIEHTGETVDGVLRDPVITKDMEF